MVIPKLMTKVINEKNIWDERTEQIQISRTMTIKGKKNSKIKIITNKSKHKHWSNIFERKRTMSEYFSDSAFGSQSDTKVEFPRARDDPELMAKYRVRLIIDAHSYNEDETSDTTNIALMKEFPNINKKEDET